MKQNILKKAISLLLTLTMLMPLASPAFAAEATEESEVMPYQSDVGLQGIGGDGDSQLFGGGFTGWGLKTLAGGTISGLAGIGLNQAFTAIFGKDSDRVMEAIAQLSKQIGKIDAKLDSIIKMMEIKDINDFLNDYRKTIAPYKALFKEMQTAKELYGDDTAKSKQFALDIYYGNDPSLKDCGNNIMGVVRNMRAILVDDIRTVQGQSCNVFGAFDMLEKYINRWEHQGYDSRCQFRNMALGVFADFAALAEIACDEAVADCKARKDDAGLQRAQLAKKNLEKHCAAVEEMDKKCAVIQHPDLRIVRGTEGSNLYAFYRDVHVASLRNLSDEECEKGMYTHHDYLRSMFPPPGGYVKGAEWAVWYYRPEVTSNQAAAGELRDVRWLYGNTNGHKDDYKKTLYDILFDPKEGDFNNVGKLKRGTSFTGNQYKHFFYTSGLFTITDYFRLEATEFLPDRDNELTKAEVKRLLRVKNGRTVDHWSDEKYFSVVRYNGYIQQGDLSGPVPTPDPNDGLISGMDSSYELPCSDRVTLSVEEKTDATYQWFVYKGNSGETFEEIENETNATYTLPTLEASMNGYMYRCAIIEENVSEWGEGYTLADPVTLNLTGEGVPAPVTEHEVGNATELKATLDKVADGSWNNHVLKLTNDITYPHPITLSGGCDVTIDLNGHMLTVQSDSTAEPNINPMSNNAEIAAIYVHFGSLSLIGGGALNVVAGDGIAYGVYAGESGSFGDLDDPNHDPNYGHEVTVTSTDGGTGIYATDGGTVVFCGDVAAEGDNAYAIKCFDGGTVRVDGTIAANGKSTCGVYMGSNGSPTYAGGWAFIEVSGENSRGAYVSGQGTRLSLLGGITATGDGASGLMAGGGIPGDYTTECIAHVDGEITASSDAVIACDGARVQVMGNVTVTEESAAAVSAMGAIVELYGDVVSNGSSGTGISASAWDLIAPAMGAEVTIDGNITADTPLRIENLPVEESEHTEETTKQDYYTFTDGISTIWAKPGALISTDINAKVPSITAHPQGGRVDVGGAITLTVQARGGGVLSYQWYCSTEEEHAGAAAIEGADSASYSPPTDTEGIRYYYVVVTNTDDGAAGKKTASTLSSLAAVRVGEEPITDIYKVVADIAALSIGYAPGDSAAAVTQNVSLTVTGAVYGSSITWTSSNASVISDSGVVTRPGFASGDAAVTVTAAVYNNGASSTKDFDLVVLRLPQITYTVIFDKNGGDTEASPTTKEVISGENVDVLPTAPTRSGYTFIGWNTQANGSGTAFTAATAVTGSITVYAQWSRNSSGGGGDLSGGSGRTSTPVETPKTQINVEGNTATATTTAKAIVDNSGNVATTVSRTQVSDAIGKAMEEAEKQGEDTVARVEIKVEASADAAAVETSIPKEAVSQAAEAGIGALTISTPVASITLDANTLSALSEEATGDVKITASKVEAASLCPAAQQTVGDRPVFDFSVTSGDKTISQFRGNVSVSVPYTPKEGEDTNAIVIYYINDSGELEVVSNCIYDPATGMISFSTRHFSKYAVGYNKVSFKDVAENAWYGKAVGFIAAREITTGTGGGNFSPEAKLTRGQFIVMLMRAYGIAPDTDSKDNFADAGDTYYTGYLAAAKRLSISNGVGNNLFAPDREITRQEMFTLLYNALKAIGRLPEGTAGKPLSSFADAENVASWAKEAMTLLVETGTISGNGGKLSPTSTTTRAEMAQVLYNLLSK